MVGEQLKIYRKKKGYSINQLAEKADIAKSYISSIERGIQKNPTLKVLSKLAQALDTNIEMLYEEKTLIESYFEMDAEWLMLVQQAIEQGVTKDDFSYYLDWIKFKQIKDRTKNAL